MSLNNDRNDLPVVLLYNLDRTWAPDEIEYSIHASELLESGLRAQGHLVTPVVIDTQDLVTPLSQYRPDEHIILNWCEGVPGLPNSDAYVAQTLEDLGFAYTGSPPDVLAFSQDKRQVKRVLDQQSIPTPEWRIYDSARRNGWKRFPAIVKPALEHCSFGVTQDAVVFTHQELYDRIAYVIDTFRQPALVEDFIDGREFRVALWGNGVIRMLPPAEMDFSAFDDVHDRLCTYDAKFDSGSAHYNKIQTLLPAPLSQPELETLEQVSIAAYHATGCRDYARLDIRLRDGVFYVLDVNPNADISADASIACMAELAGYSYGAMGSHLVNLAALRHPSLGNHPCLLKQ